MNKEKEIKLPFSICKRLLSNNGKEKVAKEAVILFSEKIMIYANELARKSADNARVDNFKVIQRKHVEAVI